MAGTISSLGLGSGTLTSDVIDKLREGDEGNLIKPLDAKIETANLKIKSFDLLKGLMSTFQTSVSKLANDTLFVSRSVSGNNDAVSVSALAGSDVQTFSISDIVTAQSEVEHSTSTITSKTLPFSTPSSNPIGTGTLSLSIGTETFEIGYTPATTLEELTASINEIAGSKVTASILQVGSDKYELVIKSDSVGANQAIAFSDSLNNGTDDGSSLLTALGMTQIQEARDASFKYNGIAITRSTNEISDLINGTTITLKQDQAAKTNIAINQNKTEISTEMSLMIQNYNALITNIRDMTAYDKEAGKVGVFNGDSFIKSISRDMNRILTAVNTDGKSLVDYGISVDKSGVMSLDNTVFDAKMAEDPIALQAIFSGSTVNGVERPGVFDTLYEQVKNYSGYQKQFETFGTNLSDTLQSLNTNRENTLKRLDARYEIMTRQFSAYDAIISKINNQFSSLKQMIESQLAASQS
jgi:flagellar hook-associated protein 2